MKRALLAAAGLVAGLLLLEAAYRWQLLPFYAPEMRRFNPDPVPEGAETVVLALGDSQTASPYSWAGLLNHAQQRFFVVNAAIPGTCPVQQLLILPQRMRQFRPGAVVCQLYVGNDLVDVAGPIDWRNMSPARNLYYLISPWLRFPAYLNYRLGQMLFPRPGELPDDRARQDARTQAVEASAARERACFAAEPFLLENAILARGERRPAYEALLRTVDGVLALTRDADRTLFLVVPHAAQVSPGGRAAAMDRGARFADARALEMTDYPFVAELEAHVRADPRAKVVNPLERFRRAAQNGEEVFWIDNVHVNERGSQLLAECVLEALEKTLAPTGPTRPGENERSMEAYCPR